MGFCPPQNKWNVGKIDKVSPQQSGGKTICTRGNEIRKAYTLEASIFIDSAIMDED